MRSTPSTRATSPTRTPTLAALRADQPVFYDDSLDMWVVTRHADVEHVFRHPDTFS